MTHSIGTIVTVFVRRKRRKMVVAGTHTLRRKGRNRELAYRVTGDETSLDREQLILASLDEVLWVRISPGDRSLKSTGETMDRSAALRRLAEVKGEISVSRSNHAQANYEKADAVGLDNCKIGEPIEVKFSDIGWTEVKFAGFVRASGNVRFEHRGRKRTTSPANARPINRS